jgi:predicted nucleic acid-binding Zn ribbon protein
VSTSPPLQPHEARTPPSVEELERRRILSSRLFFGAGGLIAVSAVLPWVSVLGIISAHPSGGQILFIFLFAAACGGAGYLVRQRRATRTLLIGMWAVNALLGLIIIGFYSSLSEGEGIVGPAAGVFVAGIGVIVGIAATVQLHRSRAKPAIIDPPAGTQMSPDGNWWWDGSSWREMSQQSRRIETSQRPPSPPHQDDRATKPAGSTPSPQLAQAFCQDCGRPMDPNQRFCPACGVKQAEIG